ncbi:hypothetical protein A6I87_02705 [Prescottella equi]|uniref:hypothetical protein n=1 Tax=Rhodococcus hoagii TaxID=43767 RepID=UPI000A11A799|nr:hypothetical protein [Prescottella equi]ORL38314.1 hypothetical protein A6I87_02705 [Prescottella equi]
MSYSKFREKWFPRPDPRTPVTPEAIEHIEDGVKRAHDAIDALGDIGDNLANLVTKEEANATYATTAVAEEVALRTNGRVIPDLINSWWTWPRAWYDDVGQRIHCSGVGRSGIQKVGTYHLRSGKTDEVVTNVVNRLPDDHNPPAFWLGEKRRPITVSNGHDQDTLIRIRRGFQDGDLKSLGPEFTFDIKTVVPDATGVSYEQIIDRPGSMTERAIMCRVSSPTAIGWYVVRSSDDGVVFASAFRLHGKSYQAVRRVGDLLHVWVSDNPQNNVGLYAFSINLRTGRIYNHANTEIAADFWTTNATITASAMTFITSRTQPKSLRLFDISQDGKSALVGEFDAGQLNSMQYAKLSRPASSAVLDPIIGAGVPFGYNASFYTGGMCFGGTDSVIYLVRENQGVWTLERWTYDTAWKLDRVLYTAPPGAKLGRPQVPYLGESTGWVLVGVYYHYAADGYADYYADQLLIKE